MKGRYQLHVVLPEVPSQPWSAFLTGLVSVPHLVSLSDSELPCTAVQVAHCTVVPVPRRRQSRHRPCRTFTIADGAKLSCSKKDRCIMMNFFLINGNLEEGGSF